MQGLHQFFGAERHLLADRERRSVMVDPEGEKLHAALAGKTRAPFYLFPLTRCAAVRDV
jgi:hypothetical protein